MFRIVYLLFLLIKYSIINFLAKIGLYKTPRETILKKFLEDAGGTFIKFGQVLSLRVDILPTKFALELMNLFDNVKPFPYKDVEKTFFQELGAKPNKIFYHFEKEPFASASFGQVHGAKLDKDKIVAVKVMRPGIESKILADFLIIDILAIFGDFFFKIDALPWKEFAAEFKRWTRQELDYRIEAEHSERMRKNLLDSKLIVVPKVFFEFSTRRILVADYIEGIQLSKVLLGLKDGRLDAEKMLKRGIDIKKTPKTLVREILREFLFDGIYHADPHPGNILLLPNDKIALIDFGIVGESIVSNKASFVKWLKTGENADYSKATLYFINFVGDYSKTMIGSALPATYPREKVDEFMSLLADYFSKTVARISENNRKELGDMKKDYTVIFLEIINSARKFRIKLPKEMVSFIRTLTIVGFLAKELDPKFKIADEVRDFFKVYPEEEILRNINDFTPIRRISRERALEDLHGWLSYLMEVDLELYKLVRSYTRQYNL